MKSNYDYVIFDFDGTLADTLPGIEKALNITAKKMNINKEFTKDETKNLIGGGAKRLFLRAFNFFELNDKDLSLYNLFMDEYYKQQISNFVIYKNVLEVLKVLEKNNINLIIYSNKPEEILNKCVSNKFQSIKFLKVVGNNLSLPPKPNTTYFMKIVDELKIDLTRSIYVGDSIYDLEFANNLKIDCAICDYGYGNYADIKNKKPKYLISNFNELLRIILKK